MSGAELTRELLGDGLRQQWAALDALLASLPGEAWRQPSFLPGWTIQDIVAHVIGTEAWLVHEPDPPSEVDVSALLRERNDISGFNQCWVEALRGAGPSAVMERFRDVMAKRAEALAGMTQEDFDKVSWTPAGESSYGRFMRIRVFDMWLHEQDIRDVVRAPGHEDGLPAELSFDEMQAALGYLVGKRAGAPQGSSVTFDIRGPLYRTLHVLVDGRARLVDKLDGQATTTLRLSSGLFARLAGGRAHPDEDVEIEGDVALGRRVSGSLAFTV